MDNEQIMRLRKLRDEIDKIIDEEINKGTPVPYGPYKYYPPIPLTPQYPHYYVYSPFIPPPMVEWKFYC